MRGARQVGGLEAWLAQERGRLFPWVPVAMGTGAALWLGWPGDPSRLVLGAAAVLLLSGFGSVVRGGLVFQASGAAILALCAGFLLTEWRAMQVAAPVLGFRYYGPVEGRVVMIDRSGADRLRLTLDRVVLDRVAPGKVPDRVRVSLHGAQGFVRPEAGMRVMMTAHLAPPEGAAEPGGFDFRRLAWFRGIGAIGYTRTPVLEQAPPGLWDARVTRLRMDLSGVVQARIAGEAGAFASAMMTGDRSGMGAVAVAALRDSNLYHLVSISGVHMSLLAGFVFMTLRSGLALVPPLALRIPTRKVAAVVALAAAGFYLVLSGGDVATERAFIMVAVMLVAVLLDRRAISLRSIAIAATLILAVQPESVAEPGFQMSFAATAALVAGFTALRGRWSLQRLPWFLRPLVMSLLASLLAGFASAPFAALHFNRFADYGLLANLLASPVMAILVMPGGVMAAALAPVGLEGPGLWLLELGCHWILVVAVWVAGLEGSVTMLPMPPGWVMPVLGTGGCLLVLLRGHARLLALPPLLAVGLVGWGSDVRPALLIAGGGGLIGVYGPEGRALSRPRGEGFVAGVWLEHDGDGADQAQAAARPGFIGPAGERRAALAGVPVTHLSGKGAQERLAEICAGGGVVVLAARAEEPSGPCLLLDEGALRRTGAMAGRVTAEGLLLIGAQPMHHRPWTGTSSPPETAAILVPPPGRGGQSRQPRWRDPAYSKFPQCQADICRP